MCENDRLELDTGHTSLSSVYRNVNWTTRIRKPDPGPYLPDAWACPTQSFTSNAHQCDTKQSFCKNGP